MVYSTEAREAVKRRREANRAFRAARKAAVGEEAALRTYRIEQQRVRETVESELRNRERKTLSFVLNAPRHEKSRRFWRIVNRDNRGERKLVKLRDQSGFGREIPETEIDNHLTHVGKRLLEAIHPVNDTPRKGKIQPTGVEVTSVDISRALASLSKASAMGLDGIPSGIVKDFEDIGRGYIVELFNKILAGDEETPEDWEEGRLVMIEKANSIKGNLLTYRPITISPTLYRIFMKILGAKISEWMEEKKLKRVWSTSVFSVINPSV